MGTTTAKTARKAIKATGGTARPRAMPIPDPDDVPAELRDFYGPPQLSRARGAGTAGPDGETSLDFTTPTRQDIADIPMEKLFSIDGKDYFIPIEFPPGIGVMYLDGISEGRDVALGRCMKAVVGEKSWGELAAFVQRTQGGGISGPQMAYLLDKIMKKVLGTLEANGEGNG